VKTQISWESGVPPRREPIPHATKRRERYGGSTPAKSDGNGLFYVFKRKKIEYLDFAGVPVLVHLTEVRYFGLAHKNLSRITESRIPRFHFVKGVGVSIFKAAQLRSQFAFFV
jgi:hypothetical protein